ncbi:MAG: transketolase [Bordetella sp. SCN 67-23]|nr:transketolase [Burkholderiales bacterium]ODS68992.1 MAG: transketolase [Bordetella sp. SCN 67-23]ODU82762.1 MAG: transketolase [Bordetella sp. SCN 68-11]OJW94314.1 MAG: transketolase [Burkholderiales bacterium 67-32]
MSNQAASQLNMADAIRALSMDAVQKANSGHPGAPMGMAEIALALWHGHLRHNPANPAWADRDRFVLSNGHGSMLIYSLLHLTGYDLSIEELRNFRQMHSKTPGHPEVGITPGVETTTGPLGQGVSNAVGMALAEALLAAEFNRPGLPIVDHFTYAFVGDGCLMEGISHEVASLAGTLKLSKLVVLYDSNGISIDGEIKNWFADDTAKRFEAYGWNVIRHVDGHDAQAVDAAIAQAKAQAGKHGGPTLIECRTVIGKGAPTMAGTDKVHGSPLGDKEIAATREAIGWPYAPFEIPAEVYAFWDGKAKGAQTEGAWNELFARYAAQFPEQAAEFERRMRGDLPAEFAEKFAQFLAETNQKQETVATRKASQFSITALAGMLPELLGGSADLTGSNYTDWKGVAPVRAGNDGIEFGRHINYGVREFGMAAIMNGIALHGGYLPFGGTFLTFSDYSRNALRMAALMKQRVVHVFTHDSIGLGEDGPTHQSVEHAASLRLIPNLAVWRPCDTTETAVAWGAAVERPASIGMDVHAGGPSALLLSRQNLPFVERDQATIANISRGGYVLRDALNPRAVIIATGSEIALALAAQEALAKDEIFVRVVSMPCTQVFDRQDDAWRQHVLPRSLPRVAVEAGVTDYWRKYVGLDGEVVGIDTYGESAPAGVLFKHFGFTTERVVEAVRKLVG